MKAGLVEGYVRDLSAMLPGPRRLRREMLDELADGLWDAAEAYHAAGLSRQEAERRAVADSGDPRALAADYRAELAAHSGRRTAALLTISMFASILAWDLIWRGSPSGPVSPLVTQLSGVVDAAALAGGSIAALCIGLLAWSGRRRTGVRLVNAALVAAGALSIGVIGVGSLAMNLVSPTHVAEVLITSPHVMALGAVSAVIAGVQASALCHTARVTFSRRLA